MVGKRDRDAVFAKTVRNKKRTRTGASDPVVVVAPTPAATVRAEADLVRSLLAKAARDRRGKENKTYDSTAAPVDIANCFSNAGSVAPTPFVPVTGYSAFCLNQIAAGNTAVTRVGRRLMMKAIALRGSIFAGASGTTALANMVLVYDRKPNEPAAIPAFSEVFASQNSCALTNKNNAPRFKILRRWDYAINGDENATSQTSNTRIFFDEFVKLKNKPTVFIANDTGGTLPAMVEGALYLYCLGVLAPGATCPSLTIQTRVYYDDEE